MLKAGVLRSEQYHPITVRVLEMNRSAASQMIGSASRLNRDAAFIRRLIDLGGVKAGAFLAVLDFERAWDHGGP